MRKNYATKAVVYFLAINLIFNCLAPFVRAMDMEVSEQAAVIQKEDEIKTAADNSDVTPPDGKKTPSEIREETFELPIEEYEMELNDQVIEDTKEETEIKDDISEVSPENKVEPDDAGNVLSDTKEMEVVKDDYQLSEENKNETEFKKDIIPSENDSEENNEGDTAKKINSKNDDLKNNEQFLNFFKYVPGDIIVKYKDGEKNLRDILKNKKIKTKVEGNIAKGKSGKIKETKDTGARLYKIEDLGKKANEFAAKIKKGKIPAKLTFWQKVKNKIKSLLGQEAEKKEEEKSIKVSTDEFGEVEIDLENNKEVDPYTMEILEKLNSDPNIEYAEVNGVVNAFIDAENNPYYSLMWGLENSGQSYPSGSGEKKGAADADIDASTGWDKSKSNGGENIIVAVIDTGIDYTHEDLGGCVISQINDEDPLTCPKFVPGFDFANYDNDPMDDHGHGTHCAGTIAALNNDKGIVGVAYNARLMALKGLSSDGSGYMWDLAQSVQWAADNGANVLSNSWGGAGDSKTLEEAFQYAYSKGVISIAAAGNEYGADALEVFPAKYDTVITIGASDSKDTLAYFSNIGPKIDVVAPGMDILSLRAEDTDMYGDGSHVFNEKYFIASGTSMSTPHAAGVAALIKADHLGYNPEQIRQAIRTGADDLGDKGFDEIFGYGRLNLEKSLSQENIPVPKLLSPTNNETVGGIITVSGSVSGSSDTVKSWALYYRQDGNSSSTPIVGDNCAGTGPVLNFECEFDGGMLNEGTALILLKASNGKEEFFDTRKIIINNLEITNIAGNDIYKPGDKLEIRGVVNNKNFILEWKSNGDSEWSSDRMTVNDDASLNQETILGKWDTSEFNRGYYDLRLKSSSSIEQVNKIYFDPDLRSGWPVRIEWDTADDLFNNNIMKVKKDGKFYFTGIDRDKKEIKKVALRGEKEINTFLDNEYNVNSSYWWGGHHFPVVADVTGDGIKELVVPKIGVPSKIMIYNESGSLLKTLPIAPSSYVSNISVPLVEDIDGDHINEILVYAGDSGDYNNYLSRLYAFNADGTNVAGYPVELPFNNSANLTAEDLDNDGVKEIIVLENATFEKRQLTIIKNAKIFSRFDVEDSYWGNLNEVYSNAAVGNFDNDSDLEIVVAGPSANSGYDWGKGEWNLEGMIAVYNIDGSMVDGWPKTVDDNIWSSPSIGDINNDGYFEIAIGTDVGMYVFNKNGIVLPGWPLVKGSSVWTSPALADIDNDGYLEISFSKTGGVGHTYLADYSGNVLPGWPQKTPWVDIYSTNIADVNNDNSLDIITVVDSNIYAWGSDGAPLNGFPKIIESSFFGNNGVSVSDIDNDGKLELIASSNCDYNEQTGMTKHRGTVYVWDLKSGYNAKSMPWPTFQHDEQRTGNSPTGNTERPINLYANGHNPSEWRNNPKFIISWDNLKSLYPKVWYKLGSVPSSNEDGISTSSPLIISATEKGGQMLYVWLENNDGNKDYRKYTTVELRYDTAPFPPLNLIADGFNPSPLKKNSRFTIDWADSESFNITGAWYKLGEKPANNEDGKFTLEKPFDVKATKTDGQILYVWLQDDGGNKNYKNHSSVILNYEKVAVALPKNIKLLPEDKKAIMTWESGDETVDTKYNIYQSSEYNLFNDSPINSSPIDKNSYTVENLENWKTYYFALRAVDEDGNESALSDSFFVTPYPGPYLQFGDEVSITANAVYSGVDIYENKIVWEDYRSGNSDIYLYDTLSGKETRITLNLSGQYTPAINGDKIVWRDQRNYNADIYMYDLAKGEEKEVVYNLNEQYTPDIFGNKIVWRDNINSRQDIYLYDLDLNSERKLSLGLTSPWAPKIYENKVIWSEVKNGSSDIYLYDLNNSLQTKILANISGYFIPNIYKNRIVWADTKEGNEDIYMYDIEDSSTARVTYNGNAQNEPDIYNNKIIFSDTRNNNSDIYLYDISTKNEYQITSNLSAQYSPKIYKDKIIWQDNRNGEPRIYMRKVYTVPNAPLNLTADGANPSPVKNTPEFEIKWEESFDSSGIKGAWYKLGSEPTGNEDGTFVADKTFKVKASAANQTLYLWLENNDGYKDYSHFAKVLLRYELPPPSGGGGSSGGGGGSSGGGGGYSGGGSAGGSSGGGGGSSPVSAPEPKKVTPPEIKIPENPKNEAKPEEKRKGRILGESIDKRAVQLEKILNEAEIIFLSGNGIEKIISYSGHAKDVKAQSAGMEKYTNPIVKGVVSLAKGHINAINNFIVYGTETTIVLGEGERAGVVSSYKKAFGKVPETKEEWRDCVSIANGRWPSEKNNAAEAKARKEFKKIYKRDANMANSNDNAAITIIAYGLRPSARNLKAEAPAIKIFKAIYKYNPKSAADWDIARAIAYSGAKR